MTQPVFQQALGPGWERLGDVIRRHYTMAPFSDDRVCVRGTMNEVHPVSYTHLTLPTNREV